MRAEEVCDLPCLSFSVPRGQVVAIVGDSNERKTAFLLTLAGLGIYSDPTTNIHLDVTLDGKDIAFFQKSGKTSYVASDPTVQITGMANLLSQELLICDEQQRDYSSHTESPASLFTLQFQILKKLHFKIEWLSGGELQRLILARSLSGFPEILVWNDPFGEIDSESRLHLLRAFLGFLTCRRAVGVIGLSKADPLVAHCHKVIDFDVKQARTTNDTPPDWGNHHLRRKGKARPLLEVEGLFMALPESNRTLFAGLSFSLVAGEQVFLVGENGAGKSTLGKLLRKEKTGYAGSLRLAGEELSRLSVEYIISQIGIAPQNPNLAIIYETVDKELFLGREKSSLVLTRNLSRLFSLDRLLEKHPFDLNGEMRRRLAIASAAASRPKVLFLDEPSLQQTSEFIDMFASFRRILEEYEIAMICATHDHRLLGAGMDTKKVVLSSPTIIDERLEMRVPEARNATIGNEIATHSNRVLTVGIKLLERVMHFLGISS